MADANSSADRQLTERLLKLQSIADTALAHLSLQDLLDELLERVRQILDADTCAVLLLDEETNELVARAARGIEEEVEQGVRIPVGKGFAGRIAAERRVVAIEDVDHADVLNPILRQKGIKSLLGAPLLARGRVLGVVHVGTLSPRRFDAEDIELLGLAAERAGMGIDKALLHQDLMRLDEIRHRFVSTASHELRTPTAAIYGAAETLERLAGTLSEKEETDLRRMLAEQAARLAVLVDQLLDVSRLETHAIDIKPERIRVSPRLETIVSGMAPKGTVAVESPPDLEIEADPVAFDRVVGNLIANALRHGGPPIVVSAQLDHRHVRIMVEDRGEGVPHEFRSRLFEQFTRSSTSEGKPGSGLGLAIARLYAHAHGGDIVYEDAQPNGARFEFVLPARLPAD
jgi:signal transduction histidine kinase